MPVGECEAAFRLQQSLGMRMSWGLSLLEWSLALLAFGVMSFLASPAHSSELEPEKAAAEATLAGS